jgi:hypothetical protein
MHRNNLSVNRASRYLKRFLQLAPTGCVLAMAGIVGLKVTETRTNKAQREAYLGSFWEHRASYPTGHFSPQWQLDAIEQESQISKSTPAGTARSKSSGPLARGLDPNNFTPLGPRPLNTLTNGFAGRVNVIVTHPTNPAIAWLGSDGGGVWKTTNCCTASTEWTIKTDSPQIQASAIGDMTIDPSDSNTLYAATGDLRFGSFSFGSNGLLKSTDGGETWTVKGESVFNPFYPPSANGFPQYQAMGQVDVDPNNRNNIVVGTKTGLFLSFDGGDNWTGPCLTNPHTTQRQDITGLELRADGFQTRMIVAIGTRAFETTVQANLNQNGANGLYRGTLPANGCPTDFTLISRPDNGWPVGSGSGISIATVGNPNLNPLGRIDITMAPSNNNILYAQVARPNRASPDILGVWQSIDFGDTWVQKTIGNVPSAGTQSWYNAGLTVSPTDPQVVWLSAFNTFRSTTGGSAFANVATSPHVDHHARAFVNNDPNQILIGTDGGVYYAANAQATSPTWLSLNNTLNTIEFYSGGISENFATAATASAVGGAQDNSCMVSTWTNGNFAPQLWPRRNGGDGFSSTIEPILNQRWYYSSQNGAIVVSSSFQGTATQSAAPSGWGADRKSFLTQFDLYRFGGETTGCPAATGCGRIITGSFRVWESITGGVPTSSYFANSPDLTKGTLADRSFINQVSYAYSTPSQAIAGTNDGNVWLGFDMGRAAENPQVLATWVNLTDGNAVLPNRPVMDVITDAANPLKGYAVVGGFNQNTPAQPGHVFQYTCTAGCASFSWRNVSGNLPNIPVNAVMTNPNKLDQLFIGNDWGLYYTDNVNANPVVWQKHAGLPSVMIWDLTIDRGATTLAAWTRSRGAWVWPLPTAVADGRIFANGFE